MEIPNTPTTDQPKKFSPEEMKELVEIKKTYEQLTVALGQLQLQKREHEKNSRLVEEELVLAEKKEKEFLEKILKKFGEGTVDPETGVFTPKKV